MTAVAQAYGNNPARLLAAGRPVFASLEPSDPATARSVAVSAVDVVVFDMEHGSWDPAGLRDTLQHMLDRRQVWDSPDLGPTVAPWVRVPQAPGHETAQWFAQQVLDAGAYGVVWPRVGSVEQVQERSQR